MYNSSSWKSLQIRLRNNYWELFMLIFSAHNRNVPLEMINIIVCIVFFILEPPQNEEIDEEAGKKVTLWKFWKHNIIDATFKLLG